MLLRDILKDVKGSKYRKTNDIAVGDDKSQLDDRIATYEAQVKSAEGRGDYNTAETLKEKIVAIKNSDVYKTGDDKDVLTLDPKKTKDAIEVVERLKGNDGRIYVIKKVDDGTFHVETAWGGAIGRDLTLEAARKIVTGDRKTKDDAPDNLPPDYIDSLVAKIKDIVKSNGDKEKGKGFLHELQSLTGRPYTELQTALEG